MVLGVCRSISRGSDHSTGETLIAIKTAKKSASNLRENFLAFTNFYLHSNL